MFKPVELKAPDTAEQVVPRLRTSSKKKEASVDIVIDRGI